MTPNPSHLIWIDLEMTGLEPARDKIIEIAVVVTDVNLNVVAESPVLAVHQSDDLLNSMDEWCTRQHGNSGLTERVRQSQITEVQAEQQMIDFLKDYVPAGVSPMCGNTVSQDRLFLNRYMPKLEKFFHYRQIDVSTLKELARRWHPNWIDFKKSSQHLASADIHESIAELRYYRENLFKLPSILSPIA